MKTSPVSRACDAGASPRRRWRAALTVAVSGLLVLTACGAEPTPAPATVQAAATQIAPTVAAARTEIAPTVAAARTQVAGTVPLVQTAVAPTVAAVQTQVVGTVQTAGTQVAPTVQAAQTAVAPTAAAARGTVDAAATQIAPTVAAAQTQVAPTVQVVQTQIAATFGPPIATTTAASTAQITAVRVSQDDTTIVVANAGAEQLNISAWILTLGSFPLVLPASANLRIEPGRSVTLHLARGTDSPTDVYLGQAPQPLVNSLTPGTRIALVNLRGQVASIYQLP